MTSTDRIEKRVVLRATRARVYRAIADAREFGRWFRVNFEGRFEPGATTRGKITYPGYEHVTTEERVERMEPERYFSFRWHPYAGEPGYDYTGEPSTLVEFTLRDHADGTELTIVESGFDAIPAKRRAEAFRMNERGWSEQTGNIQRHVETT